MQTRQKARLVLEDGSVYPGWSFGHPSSVAGEVVFNTAMTGYPESLTDPSYTGQILVATYPLMGNYGVPQTRNAQGIPEGFESDRIHTAGLIISDYSRRFSHWNAAGSLGQWLYDNQVPALFGIDTRALTKTLRNSGSMLGKILKGDQEIAWYDPNRHVLPGQVCLREKQVYGSGKHRILLVDCGLKYNIVRSLLKYDVQLIRVPWDHDLSQETYDGLFISNGPGNPAMCQPLIAHLKKAIRKDKPIFGICLGSQLLGLAAGAPVYKMKYGHRSHNQPVIEVDTGRCFITSQNHGYALDHNQLSDEWFPAFLNLNDQSCEGIRHREKPFFSTQFHPEAAGGPTDTAFLFDRFIQMLEKTA